MVSIIVPIYGVEAYLPECVESLLVQTYQKLEIILVDDASPDGCGRICDEYAQKDSRIKVIHKQNGGAASARNAGLDAATGDYICFVDADDVTEKGYVQHLLTSLLESEADIAVCGYYDWTKTQKKIAQPKASGVYTQEEYLRCFLVDWTSALLWNKIYRREVVGTLRMAEGHKIDDEFFTYRIVMNSKKVFVTDAPLYGYRIRKSGVMQGSARHAEQIMLDRIEYTTLRYADIERAYPALAHDFLLDAFDSLTRYKCCSKDMEKAQAQIRQWINRHFWKILNLRMPLRIKLADLYCLYLEKPKALPVADVTRIEPEECFD